MVFGIFLIDSFKDDGIVVIEDGVLYVEVKNELEGVFVLVLERILLILLIGI